ncbi:MAG: GNAT family N-acetyltransferase [Proteobacteria bacterium]|nr:GNAT family N-acetyltransferase [Pseudomonadota bacterium]
MASTRKLVPAEAWQLARHLLALSPDERRLRFHGAVADAVIERYCRRVDWFRTVAVGHFVDGRLRGVAELILERSLWPRAGEIAVTVETPWRGRGVGTELMRRAVTVARNRGARRLLMLCRIENRPMHRIAAKLDAQLRVDSGAVAADLGLTLATPWTMLEELVLDGTGLLAP